MRYTKEEKIKWVELYKNGRAIQIPAGVTRETFMSNVRVWTRMSDILGPESLSHRYFDRTYTAEERMAAVSRVLAGETYAKVANSMGMVQSSVVLQWHRVYMQKGFAGFESMRKGRKAKMPKARSKKLTASEKEELSVLRARNDYLEAENEYLKKLSAVVQEREQAQAKARKRAIKELREKGVSLPLLLKVAAVSRSTYYFETNKSDKDAKNSGLMREIESIFSENDGKYGVIRVYRETRNRGWGANHKKIRRLMSKMGLNGKRPKVKYNSYKGAIGEIAEDKLKRDFKAESPNKKWTTDVSEFALPWSKSYLSPILDMYASDIVAWDLSVRPNFEQTQRMLDEAFRKHPNLKELVFHSDQGWQYQMRQYSERLKGKGIIQSMSRKGNCLDNSIMESFFGTMKNEIFYGHEAEFTDFNSLFLAVAKYIDYFNNKRIKAKTKWMPPSIYREASISSI